MPDGDLHGDSPSVLCSVTKLPLSLLQQCWDANSSSQKSRSRAFAALQSFSLAVTASPTCKLPLNLAQGLLPEVGGFNLDGH